MRLEGFHVIWEERAGIYLGELEPKPQRAYNPFAHNVWSNAPNVIQAAPAYRSAAEVETKTNGMLGN